MTLNKFRFRLLLDGTALALLVAGLAYYWLDNTAHELLGTGFFLLLIGHNVLNRRWYGRAPTVARSLRGRVDIIVVALLAATMLVLLATSLLISHSLPFYGGFAARQAHMLAAYWAVLVVSIHLGLRWPAIMNAVFGPGVRHAAILRALAMLVAGLGVHASFEMAFGSKLVLHPTLDIWDFNDGVAGFFLNYLAIAGLWIAVTYYAAGWLRRQP